MLEYEFKIDSGRYNIETVDKLMNLYSVSFLTLFYLLSLYSVVSGRVLFGHERRKVRALHGKDIKFTYKARDIKVNKTKRIR